MTELETVLSHYDISGREIETRTGPLIHQIIFEPANGTKIKNITNHLSDITRELKLKSLRVEPIENSNYLGFEIPADNFQTVDFQTILNSPQFQSVKGTLPICLGVDIIGTPRFADLAKMPHLLVAGTTGSGKSVGLNTFVLSLIANKKPEELKFVMIDPKRIEFAAYNNQKYLLFPVISESADAFVALNDLVAEMETRYTLFEENMVKNIADYNQQNDKILPYIVCVIDEFADLMATNKQVTTLVQRLAQKARAAGIHLIMATQRPSVDVVTGVLKANFPTRLAYKVASSADSRTILDTSGAEDLLGRGDALFLSSDGSLLRVHGAYVTDNEIAALLQPYRAKITKQLKHVREMPNGPEEIKSNCLFEFWCSLKSSERKTIISWLLSLITLLIKSFLPKRRR